MSSVTLPLKAVPGQAGVFYYSGGNAGGNTTNLNFYKITKVTNECDTVTLVNANITNVYGFGFGAALPGGNGIPTIYYFGFKSGVQGLYEIDNGGTTATLISAPSAAQTWPNNSTDFINDVSGDMNVYGRVYVGFNGSGYAYIDTANACPWVNFSNVTPNATLTGTVTLSAQHSGLVPVTGVQFSVDGANIGASQAGQTTYSVSWNSGGVAPGAHTLKVQATGNGCTTLGNSFSIPITVQATSNLPIALTDKKSDAVGGSPITYNSGGNPSIGASNANRVIVVAVMYRAGVGGVSAVTVNGNAATQVASAASTSTSVSSDIWSITETAAGTSGLTTAPVVVTYTGGASIRSEIAVYRILTATPTAAAAANAKVASGCVNVSATVTSPTGGGSIGVVAARNTGATTWTGMAADFDDTIAGVDQVASGAHSQIVGSTTYNPTWTSSVSDCELSVAAWGP